MPKCGTHDTDGRHPTGCGCQPTLLVDMIETAGMELSRRELIKGAGSVGGLLALGALGGLASAAFAQSPDVQDDGKADAIYYGGPILTMVKEGDRAEALAVRNGRILAVGPLAEVEAIRGADTKIIDLGGKTLTRPSRNQSG